MHLFPGLSGGAGLSSEGWNPREAMPSELWSPASLWREAGAACVCGRWKAFRVLEAVINSRDPTEEHEVVWGAPLAPSNPVAAMLPDSTSLWQVLLGHCFCQCLLLFCSQTLFTNFKDTNSCGTILKRNGRVGASCLWAVDRFCWVNPEQSHGPIPIRKSKGGALSPYSADLKSFWVIETWSRGISMPLLSPQQDGGFTVLTC